jgi:hypothetical protein
MAGRRERRPRAAGEILDQALERWGIAEEVRSHRVFEVWEETVGPQIFAHARPVQIRRRVLRVHVDQNGWLQQLVYLKSLLLEKLNERLGGAVLSDVELRLGPFPPRPTREASPTRAGAKPPALAPEEAARLRGEVDRIRDPALRDLLGRLVSKRSDGA